MNSIGELLGGLLLVVLLPGFCSAKIRDVITDRESNTALSGDVIRAMMYWLPIYAVLWIASVTFARTLEPFPLDGTLEAETFVAALIVAILVGVLAGVIGERRWAQRIAFRLGVSKKTWKTPWLSAFSDAEAQRNWAIVWLKDGTRFLGWARYYSDQGQDSTIFLAWNKKVVDGKVKICHPGCSEWIGIEGAGVLLPPSSEISHIDFFTGHPSSKDSGTDAEASED